MFGFECPATEFECRHGGDAGQRLTAKTEAADTFQIFQCGDFARRMTRYGEQQFLTRDAAAIVADADQLGAAGRQMYRDLGGAGVEAVLH